MMPRVTPVVSVIHLMEQLQSVSTIKARFSLLWIETNGHSPRATHAHTDQWTVGPSNLSLHHQGQWAGQHPGRREPLWFIALTSPSASKSCSGKVNIWCSGHFWNICQTLICKVSALCTALPVWSGLNILASYICGELHAPSFPATRWEESTKYWLIGHCV